MTHISSPSINRCLGKFYQTLCQGIKSETLSFFNIISGTSEYMPSTVLMDDEDPKADQTNTQTSSEETTEPILIEVRDNGN